MRFSVRRERCKLSDERGEGDDDECVCSKTILTYAHGAQKHNKKRWTFGDAKMNFNGSPAESGGLVERRSPHTVTETFSFFRWEYPEWTLQLAMIGDVPVDVLESFKKRREKKSFSSAQRLAAEERVAMRAIAMRAIWPTRAWALLIQVRRATPLFPYAHWTWPGVFLSPHAHTDSSFSLFWPITWVDYFNNAANNGEIVSSALTMIRWSHRLRLSFPVLAGWLDAGGCGALKDDFNISNIQIAAIAAWAAYLRIDCGRACKRDWRAS